MNILLTGGMGFIGSHTAVVLIEAGHDVVLFDNLSNADRSVLDRIETITGRRPVFIEGDIRDAAAMEKALDGVDAVIHFAGLKAVGESVSKPVEYYDNNVNGTLVLLAAMRRKGVNRIIFSSSSTVYGTPETLPLTEDCPTGEPTNPYGRSKLHIEQILADVCRAYPEFSAVCLRDFIHVMDLADGHAKAVPYIMNHTGWIAINLGCGRGYSVLEVVKAFEKASDRSVPYELVDRREGDIAANWCDPARAERLLGWKASRTIDDMCRDAWNFESNKR